jgi:hypothetical protein
VTSPSSLSALLRRPLWAHQVESATAVFGQFITAGADPAWTTAQIEHKSARFTLDVYTDAHNRRGSHAVRIGQLIRSESIGTGADSPPETVTTPAKPTPSDAALQGLNSAHAGG